MKKIALFAGTRPEVIKLAPVYRELSANSGFEIELISTGQQRELAKRAMEDFRLEPSADLALMEENQSPEEFLGKAIKFISQVITARDIDAVIVQGDTTTALASAISAFHLKRPVAHVEAGLRTGNPESPFPEEMNRSLIGKLSTLNFCPTQRAAENLKNEGVLEDIYITGNTVVDSALWCAEEIEKGDLSVSEELLTERDYILVTCHRRENFDGPLELLCSSLQKLSSILPKAKILFPVHLNPNVKKTVEGLLGNNKNIRLLPPLSYPEMIYLIKNAALIVTDSGGLQEEAPSFGTPLIVTRVSTERPEAINAGVAKLVPLTDEENLVKEISQSFEAGEKLNCENPFGDGSSAKKIAQIIEAKWM